MVQSLERKEWRRWYNQKAWKVRRQAQLEAFPLCHYCEQIGQVTEARVVDHVIPHRGDADFFFNGEVQSLCKLCHDSVKAREENGNAPRFGLDGYPIE